MGKHHQEYLHNVASSVMGQVGGITYSGGASAFSEHECDSNEFPKNLWNQYGSKVMDALRKMGSSARGRIAACGVEHGSSTGSLCHWEVNQGRDLNAAYSGDELLTLLASYVVVAAIVDIIRAQVQKMRGDEHAAEEEFDRGMANYIHHGPRSSGMPIPHSSRYATR